MICIEETLYQALVWVVFEPNGVDAGLAVRCGLGEKIDPDGGSFAGRPAARG
jgi:hypothetical protein